MREIKFRGKRLDNGEWWHGSLVILTGRYFIFNDEGRYEVAPATVGQYTGLKDKNGREIWEGDILVQSFCHFTYSDGEPISGTFTGTVIIRTRGVCMNPCVLRYHDDDEPIKARYKSVTGRRSSIIGNVHDNPELLKTE